MSRFLVGGADTLGPLPSTTHPVDHLRLRHCVHLLPLFYQNTTDQGLDCRPFFLHILGASRPGSRCRGTLARPFLVCAGRDSHSSSSF